MSPPEKLVPQNVSHVLIRQNLGGDSVPIKKAPIKKYLKSQVQLGIVKLTKLSENLTGFKNKIYSVYQLLIVSVIKCCFEVIR
ncbi:hypothetical protein GCM10008986_09260 [Salinibacillus aidingensis]|uniref:Uncharacterized protein n=1 Tax=Salinibacillus aidingensis TaxID=237684 RepID=A0ABN1AXM7_9BACI